MTTFQSIGQNAWFMTTFTSDMATQVHNKSPLLKLQLQTVTTYMYNTADPNCSEMNTK